MLDDSHDLIKDASALRCMIAAGQYWRQLFQSLLSKINEHSHPGILYQYADSFIKDNDLDTFPKPGGTTSREESSFPSPLSVCRYNYLIHCPQSEMSREPFQRGELIRIDYVLGYDQWYVDAARTIFINEKFQVKEVPEGRAILDAGIRLCRQGNGIRDLVRAMNEKAESLGMQIFPIFCGHGIGRKIHEKPKIAAIWQMSEDFILQSGMTIALEFVAAKKVRALFQENGEHSVKCKGDVRAIHYEDTILITRDKPHVLT